ncbi:SGNH hydrolase domain-containing protein [Nocardioides maradonensis]
MWSVDALQWSVRARSSRQVPVAGKRLDIQGLRMVAVLAVVINHISKFLPGGFVGVDVFFVISGYLITGRLLRTVGAKTVGSYFGSFYLLRARRILPAALVVLFLTVVAANMAFTSTRAHEAKVDALWSVGFLANWHFANVGTDYFHQGVATSPLEHFWSLAVEEQFYVAWPIVILIVGALAARGSARSLSIYAGLASTGVIALSFGYGWIETHSNPHAAYFSTADRAWELGVGALLAAVLPLLKARSNRMATVTSLMGLAFIGIAVVATPTTSGFPVPWAAPAVLGSAMVVAAGHLGSPSNAFLTNPVAVWIGDLSYSIYLFHFPVWVIADALIPGSPVYLYGVVITGTLALSIASLYFVEEPARSGHFRSTSGHAKKLAAVIALSAVCLQLAALRPTQPPMTLSSSASRAPSIPSAKPGRSVVDDPTLVEPLPALATALQDSLRLESWPKLTNQSSIDSRTNASWCDVPLSVTACAYYPAGPVNQKKIVLAVGDSVMISWLAMLKRVFVDNGWELVSVAQGDCFAAIAPYADTLQGNGGALTENSKCDGQHRFYKQALNEVKPSLVLIDDMSDAISKVSDGHGHLLPHAQQVAGYSTGLKNIIRMAQSVGARAAVLSATPNHKDWDTCRVAGSTPLSCAQAPEDAWYEIQILDQAVVAKTKATYIDTLPLWCVDGYCPDVVDRVGVIFNDHHVTDEYAGMVSSSLERYMRHHQIL